MSGLSEIKMESRLAQRIHAAQWTVIGNLQGALASLAMLIASVALAVDAVPAAVAAGLVAALNVVAAVCSWRWSDEARRSVIADLDREAAS